MMASLAVSITKKRELNYKKLENPNKRTSKQKVSNTVVSNSLSSAVDLGSGSASTRQMVLLEIVNLRQL